MAGGSTGRRRVGRARCAARFTDAFGAAGGDTSQWFDITSFAGAGLRVRADADGTAYIEWSENDPYSTGVLYTDTVAVVAGEDDWQSFPARAEHVRLRYVNGATPLTDLDVALWVHEDPLVGDGGGGASLNAGASDGSVRDLENSSTTALTADEVWVGEWIDTTTVSSFIAFAFGLAPLAEFDIQWSADGSTVDTGLLGTTDVQATEEVTGGFYVYLSTPTTMIRRYARVRIVNGSVAQTGGAYEHTLWKYHSSSYPFTIQDIDADLSTLSTALLTRSVNAGARPDGTFDNIALPGVLRSDSFEVSGQLPSGATPAFDIVGPIVAANVIDTGWIDVSKYAFQSFHMTSDIAGIKAFLMNASDDQGNNSVTSSFLFPTATTTGVGTSVEVGAEFFDQFFRIVIINDSGTASDAWGYRSLALLTEPGPVTLSLDQPVFGFFPAPIVQSVIKGENPGGTFSALRTNGTAATLSSSALLGANDSFVSAITIHEGYVTALISLDADQDGTVIFEMATDDAMANIIGSLSFTYLASDGPQTYSVILRGDYSRLTYTNGPIGQNEFALITELQTVSQSGHIGPLNEPLSTTILGQTVRAQLFAPDDTGTRANVRRADGGGLRVAVSEYETGVPIEALTTWDTKRVTVSSAAGVQLSANPLAERKTINVQNEGTAEVFIAPTLGKVLTSSSRRTVFAASEIELDLAPGAQVWALALDVGGASATARRDPATATGGTDPNNALTSNDVRASVANGETLETDGYTAPGTHPDITQVLVGFEGRKAPSPTTETVTYQQAVSATQVGGTAITSPSIDGGTDQTYVVFIANGRANPRTVDSVVGLGLTWNEVREQTNSSTNGALSCWVATGSPSAGTVTANFLGGAVEHAHISVTRWDGADQVTPVEASAVTEAAAGGANAWSVGPVAGSITTGRFIVGINGIERDSNFTTPTTVRTDTETTHVSLEVASGTAAASNTGSGTHISGNPDWVAIGLTLKPATAIDPVVTISYEVSGTPGPTTYEFELSSTADADYEVDVTGDRSWTAADISNTSVLVTGTDVGAAPIRVDHAYIELTETESGSAQPVSVTEIGG